MPQQQSAVPEQSEHADPIERLLLQKAWLQLVNACKEVRNGQKDSDKTKSSPDTATT
ncbi:MAG TPA: hypothetical protein VFD97_03455 [Acidimicrobiia bacterium]|nr:hypothetical protein [Acidimicrobiia bacterium]